MTAYKRTRRLGRQPIPPFTKSLTLVQVANNWLSLQSEGVDAWPEASSMFNVACLCLYRRGVEKVQNNTTFQGVTERPRPLATTLWTDNTPAWPGLLVFSSDRMAVPNGAEFFSVSYHKIPDGEIGPGKMEQTFPDPEQLFRVIANLSI